jgi:hypothetical protein
MKHLFCSHSATYGSEPVRLSKLRKWIVWETNWGRNRSNVYFDDHNWNFHRVTTVTAVLPNVSHLAEQLWLCTNWNWYKLPNNASGKNWNNTHYSPRNWQSECCKSFCLGGARIFPFSFRYLFEKKNSFLRWKFAIETGNLHLSWKWVVVWCVCWIWNGAKLKALVSRLLTGLNGARLWHIIISKCTGQCSLLAALHFFFHFNKTSVFVWIEKYNWFI